jgi:hypothetical protein
VVAMRPVHSDPGAIDVSFICSAMMRGESLGAAGAAAGHVCAAVRSIARSAHVHHTIKGRFVYAAESTRT